VQNELVDVHEAIERRRQELGVLDCRLKHWSVGPAALPTARGNAKQPLVACL
jgi:hypothetical protein